MNAKLALKTLFLIFVVLVIVLMGMHNQGNVDFTLPPILATKLKLPAALMYSAFFGLGLFSGVMLTAGGKKSGGKSS